MKYLIILWCIPIMGCTINKMTSQELINIKSKIKDEALPTVCNGLENMINQQWFYDDRNDHFIYDYHFVETIETDFHSCIRQLTPSQIKQIFGQPSFENAENLCYYTCDNKTICDALVFKIYGSKIGMVGRLSCQK